MVELRYNIRHFSNASFQRNFLYFRWCRLYTKVLFVFNSFLSRLENFIFGFLFCFFWWLCCFCIFTCFLVVILFLIIFWVIYFSFFCPSISSQRSYFNVFPTDSQVFKLSRYCIWNGLMRVICPNYGFSSTFYFDLAFG